ncbi:MAG TPA: S41 family peptidase [Bacilli bacterium]|nr:S41 family peptidase [Bacilli bacterium]
MEEKEKKKSNKTSKTNKEKQVKKSVNKSKNNEKINKEKSKEQVKNNKKKEVSLVEEQKVKKILVKEEDKKKLEEKNEVVKTKNIFKRLLNKLNPEENKFNFLEIILLMFMAFVVGVFASQAISLKIPILNNTTVIEDTSELTRVYNLIINKYYGEVDKKELTSAAIKGMMNYLSDDYSMYFTEDEKNDFNERLNGVYTGLGVEITNDASNNAMIVTVFDNSSAKEANLKPGDIIAKINGEDVLGLGKEEVVKKIKGKNNYSFNMSVLRDNNLIDVKVVTKSITLSSVTSSVIEKDNEKIGYIYISIFALNTYDQFKEQLEELEKMKITSLIIDVRSNTGGHLTSVTSILDLFLNKTDVMYQIKSKDKIKKVYGTETSTRKYPIVVLTNELSASASEILASALKEAYGAKTVGIKTFGKGTMQNMLDLENGGMIKVTTEEWLTSKGNKINKDGVPVDYEVKLDEKYASNPSEETDNQLQKAIEVLTKANN